MDPKFQVNASNIFSVDPQSEIVPMSQDTTEVVLLHECYKIYNIGRVPVYVTLLDGNNGVWRDEIQENKLFPGQSVTFDNVGKYFFTSGIRIYNREQKRALVYCSQSDDLVPMVILKKPMMYHSNCEECEKDCCFIGNDGRAFMRYTRIEDCPEEIEMKQPIVFDSDYIKNVKEMYSVGVRYIPRMDEGFSGLHNAFWPTGKPSVWEELLLKLKPLVNDTTLKPLSARVSSYMRTLGQIIENISRSLDNERHHQKTIMKIVQQFSEFEKHFIIEETESTCTVLVNMFLLPLYSNFIFMKVMFCSLGYLHLLNHRSSHDTLYMRILRNDVFTTIRAATKHINEMFEKTLDFVYETASPDDIYNFLMTVRSYISVHGTTYIGVWHSLIQVPQSRWFYGYFEPNLLYSNFFGRQTANLVREATCSQMYPPLTPCYIGLMYHTLRSIEVYLWTGSSSKSKKIGGMKVTFSDHSSYIMGTKTEQSGTVDIGQAYITKLTVTGKGAVDFCAFSLSDGRELFFGTKQEDSDEEIFEMRGYAISSIFLSSDCDCLGGQAANIAVSYCSISNKS